VAQVQISSTVVQTRELPPICVKTGQPTDETLTIRGAAAPSWTYVLILFGFLPWLIVRAFASRRYEVTVPLTREVWQRYREWKRAGWIGVGAGILLGLVAVALGRDRAFLLLGITVLGALLLFWNEWVNSIGVGLSRDGGLYLTRVHPAFRDAMVSRQGPRSRVG
jgi:hypothetical protein